MKKTHETEIVILNVRLSEEAINWLDSEVQKGIYSSRSEAVRDMLRDYIHGVKR
ncbi:MAG: ribbon-helix-helix domain-containing protein [Candidatus Woesearchaeota archaeon]